MMRILIIFFLFQGAVFAQPLKVLILHYPPYVNLDTSNKPYGLTYDIVTSILNETGLDYTIDVVPWSRLIALFDGGAADMVAPMFLTEERAKKYVFADTHLHTFDMVLWQQKDREYLDINNASSLQGATIVKVKNTYTADLIEKAIEEGQLNLIETENISSQVQMIAFGRGDLGIGDKLAAYNTIHTLGYEDRIKLIFPPVQQRNAYAVFSKTTDLYIIEEFNNAQKKLQMSGSIQTLIEQVTEQFK